MIMMLNVMTGHVKKIIQNRGILRKQTSLEVLFLLDRGVDSYHKLQVIKEQFLLGVV